MMNQSKKHVWSARAETKEETLVRLDWNIDDVKRELHTAVEASDWLSVRAAATRLERLKIQKSNIAT